MGSCVESAGASVGFTSCAASSAGVAAGSCTVSCDSSVSSAGIAASCGTGTSVCTAASLLPGEGHSRRQARSIAASLVRGL